MLTLLGIIGIVAGKSSDQTENMEVIERLHRQYGRLLYDLSVRMLGDRTEAEDAVQETFIRAFRGLSTFRYGDDHLNWLYRIGTNTCLMFIRTKKRKGADLDEKIEDHVSPTSTQEHHINAREIIEQLAAELDDRGQEILAAHFGAGMDQGEVATMLGISRRAVVKRIAAIRTRVEGIWNEGSSHV